MVVKSFFEEGSKARIDYLLGVSSCEMPSEFSDVPFHEMEGSEDFLLCQLESFQFVGRLWFFALKGLDFLHVLDD